MESLQEDDLIRRRLVRASEFYSQSKASFDSARSKLFIRLGIAEPSEIAPGSWEIGHLAVVSGNFLEPVNLVVENAASDGSFFEFILGMEARRLNFGEICHQISNGGGSGMHGEFLRSIRSSRITVCLADHDRLAPDGKRSSTNLLCRKVQARYSGQFVGTFLELPCREVENFLPLEIVSSVLPGRAKVEHGHLRRFIEAQGDVVAGDCFWLYFDVKMGAQAERVRQNCEAPEAKDWLRRKLQCMSFEDAVDVLIPGFGADIIERFLENSPARAEFARFGRSDYWATHFSDWLLGLLSFVAATARQRI
jgi:hypothetical protein